MDNIVIRNTFNNRYKAKRQPNNSIKLGYIPSHYANSDLSMTPVIYNGDLTLMKTKTYVAQERFLVQIKMELPLWNNNDY